MLVLLLVAVLFLLLLILLLFLMLLFLPYLLLLITLYLGSINVNLRALKSVDFLVVVVALLVVTSHIILGCGQ